MIWFHFNIYLSKYIFFLDKIKAKLSSYETPVRFEKVTTTNDFDFEVQVEVIDNLSATKKYLQKYIQILLQKAK